MRIHQRDNRLLIVTDDFVGRGFLHECLQFKDDGSVRSDRVLLEALDLINVEEMIITETEEFHGALPIPRNTVLVDGYALDDSAFVRAADMENAQDLQSEVRDGTSDLQKADPLTLSLHAGRAIKMPRIFSPDQIWDHLMVMGANELDQLIGELHLDRMDIIDGVLHGYSELKDEEHKANVRQKLKLLLTPDRIGTIIEKGGGVVPDALKFDLECMDKRHPCLRGEHKREHSETSATPENEGPPSKKNKRPRA